MLGKLKKLLLHQDPRGSSSARLPSYFPLVHSLLVATESIFYILEWPWAGGDQFSPRLQTAPFPYLSQQLQINPC